MALNLTNMMRAPIYNFEVFMERKQPEFIATSAKRTGL